MLHKFPPRLVGKAVAFSLPIFAAMYWVAITLANGALISRQIRPNTLGVVLCSTRLWVSWHKPCTMDGSQEPRQRLIRSAHRERIPPIFFLLYEGPLMSKPM